MFTLGKTSFCLHPATPLFALYVVLTGHGRLLLLAMTSICLHEGGHALCAALCGFPPEEIELTPLGCLMRLDDEARMPRGKRLLMLLAGPAVTLGVAYLAVALTEEQLLPQTVGRSLFACNLALLSMNLLPALPLDGGRLLALLLELMLPRERVRQVMRALGYVLGVGLIVGNIAVCLRSGGWNLSLMCAGCFLLYAASVGVMSAALQELQQLMARKSRLETRGYLRGASVAVMGDLPLSAAVKLLHPSRYTMFRLLEKGTLHSLGQAGEEQLIAAYLDQPGESCRVLTEKQKKRVDKRV